jgi:predicted TIM-barrel fold metal-dependent hydrolase
MNRRQFLVSSAIFITGCRNAEQQRPSHAADNIPIVDTHQHLWDLSRFRLPWLKPAGELTRDFTMADYEIATEGLEISKAIYMEVAVAPEQKTAEAEQIVKVCADETNPTCAAVIGGLVLQESFRDYILQFRGNPHVKGVRHGLNTPQQLEDEVLIRNLQLLGNLNMSFDLLVPPRLVGQAAELAEKCADTRFVLDHCGNADPLAFNPELDWGRKPQHDANLWKRDIDKLAGQKNVICKISGIIARVPKDKATDRVLSPIINHCQDAFGPDRLVFGSDWPVCTRGAPLHIWAALLRKIVSNRSFEDRCKLFWTNAHRFYGL